MKIVVTQKELKIARFAGDDLSVELLENALNDLLERYGQL